MRSFSTYVGDGYLMSVSADFNGKSVIELVVSGGRGVPVPRTVVTFEEVLAYELVNGGPTTVLFDIERVELDYFVDQRRSQFHSTQNYLWPLKFDSVNQLPECLQAAGAWAFEVQSSVGTEGWVLCKAVRLQRQTSSGELETLYEGRSKL